MKAWWLGPILMFAGLYGLAITANPWGTPAIQPWHFISAFVGGAGLGWLLFWMQDVDP